MKISSLVVDRMAPLQKAGSYEGTLRYEVPKSVHSFTLQFVPGISSTDLAEWNITG
jgi:hypothetical protein